MYVYITIRYTIYPNKTLVIHDTRPKDEGDYSCVGLASVGSVQKYTAQLMLACKYCQWVIAETFMTIYHSLTP